MLTAAYIAAGISLIALLWLEIRSERESADRVEQQDLQDFAREFPIARTRDWEWPERRVAPKAEYVVKPKERIR